MFRAKRFGNRMLLSKPFSQVNEPAASREKWSMNTGEPIAFLFASRTFDLCRLTHRKVRVGARQLLGWRLPNFGSDGFQIIDNGNGDVPFCTTGLKDRLHVVDDGVELGCGQAFAVQDSFDVL